MSALASIGALAIELRNYETFRLLLGSFFVPLFGLLLADWLLAGARYTADDVFRSSAFRPGLIAAWMLGFLLRRGHPAEATSPRSQQRELPEARPRVRPRVFVVEARRRTRFASSS
jgi:hypothetical protein